MTAVVSPDLDLVVTFLQSRHSPQALATQSAVARWLEDRYLLPEAAPVAPEDVRALARLRAALNALVADRDVIEERTRTAIEAATALTPLAVALGPGGSLELSPSGTPVQSALARIVTAFYRCQVRGELDRLKACRGCGYAFVDVSKNRSRVWCDMALCGSRTKARTYRHRKADQARLATLAVSAEGVHPTS